MVSASIPPGHTLTLERNPATGAWEFYPVAGPFSNLPIIAWGLRHSGDLQTIIGDFGKIFDSTQPLAVRFGALQDVLTVLGNDLADFPGFTPPSPTPTPTPTPTPAPSPVTDNPNIGPVALHVALCCPPPAIDMGALPAVMSSHTGCIDEIQNRMQAIGDGKIINAIVTLVTNPQFLALVQFLLSVFGVVA